MYERALPLHRDAGDKEGEAIQQGNLGNCYARLGDVRKAMDLYEDALAISREGGYRRDEALNLSRLGNRYANLGQIAKALDMHRKALAINREIGARYGQAIDLTCLGDDYGALGQWERAIEQYRSAIEIADAIGSAQVLGEAWLALTCVQLYAGDVDAAARSIEGACRHPYPAASARRALITGIVELRQGARTAAASFQEALDRADRDLENSPSDYGSLNVRGLALAGLTLTGPKDRSGEAVEALLAARRITTDAGIVDDVLRSLAAPAPADPTGALYPLRAAAAGHLL